MLEYQLADVEIQKLIAAGKAQSENGVWTMEHRQGLDGFPVNPVLIPHVLKANALVTVHENGGHLGSRKTLVRARNLFTWKQMSTDVRKHCLSCPICQQIKGIQQWKTPPGRLSVEGRSWSVIGVDTVRGLNSPILTVTCLYTRYLFAYAMANETSKTICDILEKLFCAEGSPGMLITDNAQNLTSDEIKRLLERWGVVGKTLPRYSPWYGGWYERGHQTLMKCLSALVMESGSNWKKKLQEAVLYYNTRPFEYDDGTGLSPHEVFRGRRLWNPWNSPVGGIDAVHGELREHAVAVVRERERIGSLFEEIWIRCRKL